MRNKTSLGLSLVFGVIMIFLGFVIFNNTLFGMIQEVGKVFVFLGILTILFGIYSLRK